MSEYTRPPELDEPSFNCPYCQALAAQNWFSAHYYDEDMDENEDICLNGEPIRVSICYACKKPAFWDYSNEKMLYPDACTAPPPNADLNEDIKEIYNEAASIVNRSPRAACALLRLAVQMLLKQLGEKGEWINDDIKKMVKEGKISPKIQKALDTLRVTGNDAVHPGQIDFDEAGETVALFDWINIIADDLITKPKQIDEKYNNLPKKAKENIEERDKNKQ